MFSTIHPRTLPSQSASNLQSTAQRQRKAASAPASIEGDSKKPKKVNSELRKQQNRIASRNYREKRKQKLQLLEDITRQKKKTGAVTEDDRVTERDQPRYQHQHQLPIRERHMQSPGIYSHKEPSNIHTINSQTTTGNPNSIVVPTNHFRSNNYTSSDSSPSNTSYPFSNSSSDSSAFSPILSSSTISYTPAAAPMLPDFNQSFEPTWTAAELYDNPPSTHMPHWQNPLPPPTSTWMPDMDFTRPITTRSSEDEYAFLTPTPPPPPPPPPQQILYSNVSPTPSHFHQQQRQRVPYSDFTQLPQMFTPPPPQQFPYPNYAEDLSAPSPSPTPPLQAQPTQQKQKQKQKQREPEYRNYFRHWDGRESIGMEDSDSIDGSTRYGLEKESSSTNSTSLPSSPFFYPR